MPQDAVELEVKFLDSFEIKNEEKGEIEAVIATLDVVDKDHDIIRPDAIPDGSKVKLSDYGHSVAFGSLPVGKGVLQRKGDKVVFRGHYFMTTTRGAEAFNTIKAIGPEDQEWSFGFTVGGAAAPVEGERRQGAWRILTKLESFEVSPVIRGAGIGTRTVSIKAAGASAPPELKELPTPNTDESREDFVGRCMGSDAMQSEFPEQDQRAAVCNRQWEEKSAEPEEGKAAEVPEAKEDPAEAERKAAEIEAQRKLQAEIDQEVERFQRTRQLFNL